MKFKIKNSLKYHSDVSINKFFKWRFENLILESFIKKSFILLVFYYIFHIL